MDQVKKITEVINEYNGQFISIGVLVYNHEKFITKH